MSRAIQIPAALQDPSAAAKTNFGDFIVSVVSFSIIILGVIAVLMLMFAGFQMMTTDSFGKRSDAKKRIKEVLLGVGLALISYTVLYTINPDLVKIRVFSDPVKPSMVDGLDDNSYGDGSATGYDGMLGQNGNNTGNGTNNAPDIIPTESGYTHTTNNPRIDTDGKTRPPFDDPHWQNQTSLPGLDANTDNYVVVPIGSDIPLKTRVKVTNNTTGKSTWGIVGDRGPAHGEISLNMARELGVWTEGMGNAANQHDLKIEYYTKQ